MVGFSGMFFTEHSHNILQLCHSNQNSGNNEEMDCQQNVTFKLMIPNFLMKNLLPPQKKTGNRFGHVQTTEDQYMKVFWVNGKKMLHT